jgi:hypothetical protein
VQFANVLDLSNTLNFSEKKLLSRGLGFVPRKTSNSDPQLFFAEFAKKLQKKLQPERFQNNQQPGRVIKLKMPARETKNNPKFSGVNAPLGVFLNNFERGLRDRMNQSLAEGLKPNLSSSERKALLELRRRFELVLKPSDKGSVVVALKRPDYIREGNRYFAETGAYEQIPDSMQSENFRQLKDIIDGMVHHGFLTDTEGVLLANWTQQGYREMYFLLKIHKEKSKWHMGVPPLRPIVANVGTEYTESSKMLTQVLEPCLATAKYLIKNTDDFLTKLNNAIDSIPPENRKKLILASADIDSCYTNIPQDSALAAIKIALEEQQSRDPKYSNQFNVDIMALLELQMKNNDIHFNGKFFRQTRGLSMGQSWAPTVCNIFFAEMDDYIVRTYKPLFYGRFIDDTFILWEGTTEEIYRMEADLNSRWVGVKLNFATSSEMLPFLDVEVFVDKNDTRAVLHRPHFKPTDSHELLHRSSNHPKHVFGGILKSTVFRLKRISSRETDLRVALDIIRKALLPRGYSEKFLGKFLDPAQQPAEKTDNEVLPLVVDFDPRITEDLRWAKRTWEEFLDSNPRYKARFSSITVAWRCTKNLKRMLLNKNSNDV